MRKRRKRIRIKRSKSMMDLRQAFSFDGVLGIRAAWHIEDHEMCHCMIDA